MTYDEFARLWGVSKSTLMRWVTEGTVKVVRRARVTRITRNEFLRLVTEGQS